MAEYINREEVLVELERSVRDMNDCFDTVKYFNAADVVEREKIDKAIAEIEGALCANYMNFGLLFDIKGGKVSVDDLIKYMGMVDKDILEILKKI